MKKKILLTLMVIMLSLIAIGTISVSAATDGIYTYTVSNGEATITKCNTSASGKIVIPDTIGGYTVTSISSYAFSNCVNLTSITIPDSITSIEDWAFQNCTGITKIYWNASKVRLYADNGIFSEVGKNTSGVHVVFGNNIEKIPSYIFFPAYGAHDYLANISKVTIPDSVKSVEESAFESAINLSDIYYTGTESMWNTISISGRNGEILNATVHYNYNPILEYFKYTIANGEVTITDYDFSYHSSDEKIEIVIPDTIEGYPVTKIGFSAFCGGYHRLISVVIPDSVKIIADDAFYHCEVLESINMPSELEEIGDHAFDGCHSLETITFSNNLISIGDYAFDYCNSLTDVYYNGTEDEWNKISIGNYGNYNDGLNNATIHFIQEIKEEYHINEITIKDMSGNNLQTIPTGTFLATVSFTNVSSSADTVIILAQYTDDGAFKGLMYIQTEDVPTGSTIKLSIPVDNSNGDVAKLKAFCWESFASLTPMGNSASFPAEQ